MAAPKRRQKPKVKQRRVKVPRRKRFPQGDTRLRAPKTTTTTSTTYMATPGVAGYPNQEEQHAVTTNQEPKYAWPPVDLPALTGFTVMDGPVDNGQDNPATIYDPAGVESDPYYDANAGNSAGGQGDIYPATGSQAEGELTGGGGATVEDPSYG